MTTIQVKDVTLQMLKHLKEKGNFENYDQLILDLAKDKIKTKESMFGILKEKPIKYNKETDRMKFNSERL